MVFVILPAYNEEDGISDLLTEISLTVDDFLPALKVCVVIVNDGSSDDTLSRAHHTIAELENASLGKNLTFTVIDHQVNKGLAEAIKTGFLYCVDKANPRDVILTMDSDNSHTPGLIPSLVRQIYEGHDVAIASRYRPGAKVIGLSLYRKLLSLGASVIFQLLFPISGVRDYTCGYRAYKAQVLKEVLRNDEDFISESGFTAMVDILLKLRRYERELFMTEIPLLLRYDKKLSASKMNVNRTVKQTFNLIWRRVRGL